MSGADTLRVMTYNILYDTSPTGGGSGEDRWPLVVENIRAASPDLVAMQEVLPGRLEAIPRDFPEYRLATSEPGGNDRAVLPLLAIAAAAAALIYVRRRRHKEMGARRGPLRRAFGHVVTVALWLLVLGIPAGLGYGAWYVGGYSSLNERLTFLYRPEKLGLVSQQTFWFSPTPLKPGTRDPFSFEPRIAQLGVFVRASGDSGGAAAPGDTLVVLNVHPGHNPGADASIVELMRTIVDRRWNGGPQILLGDFNATLDSRRMVQARETGARGMPGFRDAWTTAPTKSGPPTTFNWGRVGTKKEDMRIDHVLVRGPLEPLRVETRTVTRGTLMASDHHAVVVDLAFSRNEAAPAFTK